MTASRTIGIGILGFGTVGQGVWKHLHEKQADLESRLGVHNLGQHEVPNDFILDAVVDSGTVLHQFVGR